MNPAIVILGPVIVISLLWIIAESQHRGGWLGQWYDELFGRPGGREAEEEEPGGGAHIERAPGLSRINEPGGVIIYSWGADPELCIALFRDELAQLPEIEEPVR